MTFVFTRILHDTRFTDSFCALAGIKQLNYVINYVNEKVCLLSIAEVFHC